MGKRGKRNYLAMRVSSLERARQEMLRELGRITERISVLEKRRYRRRPPGYDLPLPSMEALEPAEIEIGSKQTG